MFYALYVPSCYRSIHCLPTLAAPGRTRLPHHCLVTCYIIKIPSSSYASFSSVTPTQHHMSTSTKSTGRKGSLLTVNTSKPRRPAPRLGSSRLVDERGASHSSSIPRKRSHTQVEAGSGAGNARDGEGDSPSIPVFGGTSVAQFLYISHNKAK